MNKIKVAIEAAFSKNMNQRTAELPMFFLAVQVKIKSQMNRCMMNAIKVAMAVKMMVAIVKKL